MTACNTSAAKTSFASFISTVEVRRAFRKKSFQKNNARTSLRASSSTSTEAEAATTKTRRETVLLAAIVGLTNGTNVFSSPARASIENSDVKKQTILITGGNSGIGKTACEQLVGLGHRVILHARTPEKAEKAKKEILFKQPDADVVTMKSKCDLMDLREVKGYCAEVLEYLATPGVGEENVSNSTMQKLDSLILNAGIMAAPYELTKQNHESHFGINHLAHFLMYENLKPALFAENATSKGPARVISVSSLLAMIGELSLDVDDLDFKNRKYDKWYAYGQSKACNILFADDLAKENSKSKLVANSFHPGIVTTDLVRYSFPDLIASKRDPERERWIREQAKKIGIRDADEGCKTHVWLATDDAALEKSGEFFVDPGLVYPGATRKQLVESGDWFLVSGEEFLAPELHFPERLFDGWRNDKTRVKLRERSQDMVSEFLL